MTIRERFIDVLRPKFTPRQRARSTLRWSLHGTLLDDVRDEISALLSPANSASLADVELAPAVFARHYKFLTFYHVETWYIAPSQKTLFTRAFSDLLQRTAHETELVNIADITDISASKSDRRENARRWPTMTEFGAFAYHEHLDDNLQTLDGPVSRRDALCRSFANNVLNGPRHFSGVTRHEWCSRLTLINTGISRRFAAFIYRARQGDPFFDVAVPLPVETEVVNWSALAELERQAHTFVIAAPMRTHDQFRDRMRLEAVPFLTAIPDAHIGSAPGDATVRVYAIPRQLAPLFSLDRRAENEAMIVQANAFCELLMPLIKDGRACSLSAYVDFVIALCQSGAK